MYSLSMLPSPGARVRTTDENVTVFKFKTLDAAMSFLRNSSATIIVQYEDKSSWIDKMGAYYVLRNETSH